MVTHHKRQTNKRIQTDDVSGHAISLYEGDYGNKARPQPGMPSGATGRDPASIVAGTGQNVVMLAQLFGRALPF